MTTFEQTLRKDNHTRRFAILTESNGWRVTDRADSLVLRDTLYTDWHRVERVRAAFRLEVSVLREEGWRDER